MGLQVFFELAIPQTIIVTASHLWEKLELKDDRSIIGDEDARSQLTHLVRVSMLIYVSIAVAFGTIVGMFGLFFFARDSASTLLDWQLPWLALIFVSSLIFALIPLLSVLEGCGQVREVYKLQAQPRCPRQPVRLGCDPAWGRPMDSCHCQFRAPRVRSVRLIRNVSKFLRHLQASALGRIT